MDIEKINTCVEKNVNSILLLIVFISAISLLFNIAAFTETTKTSKQIEAFREESNKNNQELYGQFRKLQDQMVAGQEISNPSSY